MDHDRTREDTVVAAKKTLSNSGPNQLSGPSSHSKRRSHSRGNSIISLDDVFGHASSSIPSPPRSRPSSHHRRVSSVSNRRESAEVMGISLPEDGSNDGSKADMHLRALFALEGKASSPLSTSFGFTKVELPDFNAETEKKQEPSFKPLFNLNNSLAGKRDSFGKLLTPASGPKKELGTLLEEDEGEDFMNEVAPAPAPRHRPRSLNLRSSLIKPSPSLPTPSPTPPVRTPKLKSLTLASSTVVTPSSQNSTPKRASTLAISHSSPLLTAAELELAHRQSSISYRRPSDSDAGLSLSVSHPQTLTPGPSPIMEKHRRSLSPSPSELLAQSTFLAQSQASFLVRIADLEAALARTMTPSPAPPPPEPSEELLEMLSDLKSERDTLKRHVDELISQSGEQEKQISMLGRRLDNEKRDGWVSKEKLSRAETENRTLLKENERLNDELTALRQQLQITRSQLQIEKDARAKAERELIAALETPKPSEVPYPYPTSYRRNTTSLDSQFTYSEGPCHTVDAKSTHIEMHALTEEDEDLAQFPMERSTSSASFSSGLNSFQTGSASTPEDSLSPGRDDLSSGWSFAKAARRHKPKATVDNFFACLDDSDGDATTGPAVLPSLKPYGPSAAIGLGFGFSDEEEDNSSFNFGQPTSPSPFPRSDESDSESSPEVEGGPFLEEDDNNFSFAVPEEFGITAKPQPVFVAPSTPSTPSCTSPSPSCASPPPNPSQFVDPATPRPRHKAKDSMHLRRRSRTDRASTEFSGFPMITSPPRSAQSSSESFVPRSTVRNTPPTLDVHIPSSDFTSTFELSPPPPRKPQPARKASGPSTGSTERIRITPPVYVSSPPRPSASSDDSNVRPILKSSNKKDLGLGLGHNHGHGHGQAPPTPPPSTPSKSPMSMLSFSSLSNFLPSSWSPRTAPSSPTSSLGRDSFDRACASRERQLNRLRSEVIEQFGSQSSGSAHSFSFAL